ncbi:MAG: ACT domain-containing protein [Oligoflexia bacterium]|nr:ACT domain-containing protein [Oligoflexia bacterium]MBF0366825.1 ACT domain-containing protein [Oligoflexia bacterium]
MNEIRYTYFDHLEEGLGKIKLARNNRQIVFEGSDIELVTKLASGKLLIRYLDGEEIEFSGDYPALILKYSDRPEMVSKITSILYSEDVNITYMKITRHEGCGIATMLLETDNVVSEQVMKRLQELIPCGHILGMRRISPVV